jgi:predicted enzyme related to lactoylglutathione lyase
MADSHGRFVWYELTTTDMPAAAAFYAAVVGWSTRDASMPGLPYTVLSAGDAAVCGMMQLPQDARQRGERPMWLGYIGVDDVDASADRIKRLGGAVHVPPQDVMDVSRFSIVSDPQLATFALFKWRRPGQPPPVGIGTRGSVGWHELLADNWEQAWTVYSELFGWQKTKAHVGAMGTYQQFAAGGETIGGMMTKPATVPVSCWLYYFNVGDIDAAGKRVKDGGGQVLKGPAEVLDGHWIVECADPQGAIFALIGHRGVGYFPRVESREEAPGVKPR